MDANSPSALGTAGSLDTRHPYLPPNSLHTQNLGAGLMCPLGHQPTCFLSQGAGDIQVWGS